MESVVALVFVPGPPPGRPPLGDRVGPSGSSQAHSPGSAGEPHFEILRRTPLHHAGRAGFRTGRTTGCNPRARGTRTGGEPGALFAARTGGDIDCPAPSRTARAGKCPGARKIALLLGVCAAPVSQGRHRPR